MVFPVFITFLLSFHSPIWCSRGVYDVHFGLGRAIMWDHPRVDLFEFGLVQCLFGVPSCGVGVLIHGRSMRLYRRFNGWVVPVSFGGRVE